MFISETRALSKLEEELLEDISKVRERIRLKRSNFLKTDNIEQFKKSVKDLDIEEIEKEITGTSYAEAYEDGNDTIYKKKT